MGGPARIPVFVPPTKISVRGPAYKYTFFMPNLGYIALIFKAHYSSAEKQIWRGYLSYMVGSGSYFTVRPCERGSRGTSYPGPERRGPGGKVFRTSNIAKTCQNVQKSMKTDVFWCPDQKFDASNEVLLLFDTDCRNIRKNS